MVFNRADILIPKNADMTKWSVVACDQYTSEPDYWKEVKEYVEAGDREGLKAYVKESFSDSDIQEMREIYEKYK